MPKRTFKVTAIWDAEAGVFYSDSDIEGLHIEAATLDEFEEILWDLAPEMALQNHLLKSADAGAPLSDLVPAIVWQRPEVPVGA